MRGDHLLIIDTHYLGFGQFLVAAIGHSYHSLSQVQEGLTHGSLHIEHGRRTRIARIADAVSKRFQLQERIGTDIRDIMRLVTHADDVIVFIEGEHSCMTARGIKKPGTKTRTLASSGAFKTDSALRKEFLEMVK